MYKFILVFLLLIPISVSADDYTDIADDLEFCASCHGAKGASPIDDTIPIIAGQHFYYLYIQLKDMASGLRATPPNEIMASIASSYDKKKMKRLSQYFSEQEWIKTDYKSDPALSAKAKTLAGSGQCVQCHGGGFMGDKSAIPRISNQNFSYLSKTLLDYKSKARNNAAAMSSLIASYHENDIEAIVDYLAGY
jgi:cytochrome c553|tara:strand:- start:491 stop:1069 length:579 start_codon:yes stop_codon:yes gene_type:complete